MNETKTALFEEELAARLRRLEAKNRLRRLVPGQGLDFSSNDYLGLADHPGIRAALVRALEDGISLGSTGSRLLRGNSHWHENMERRLARWKGCPAALIFNSGYDANVGVLSTLIGGGDRVFADTLIHASIWDGIRAAGAHLDTFPHNDMAALERLLAAAPTAGNRFLVVESLYSMDGDRAPLALLAGLARRYRAHLIVDEAHATGVFGPSGAGLLEEAGLTAAPLVTIHTCGKAWGGFGAFVTCSRTVRDYLVNRCRRLIFTTALPPLMMAQWQAALTVIQEESWRRRRVLALADRLRSALADRVDCGASDTQIVPILLGDSQTALQKAAQLQAAGFDIRAIRPPSVPPGGARLRLALRATLKDEELESLITTCRQIFPRLNHHPAN